MKNKLVIIESGKIPKKLGSNNNAIPDKLEDEQVGKKGVVHKRTIKTVNKKVTPIIQTRGMKAKQQGVKQLTAGASMVARDDLEKLNEIDSLSAAEFAGGADAEEEEICHDGVELSIQGSDIEDSPDKGLSESGEISDSDDEEQPVGGVRSKVAKVSKVKEGTGTGSNLVMSQVANLTI